MQAPYPPIPFRPYLTVSQLRIRVRELKGQDTGTRWDLWKRICDRAHLLGCARLDVLGEDIRLAPQENRAGPGCEAAPPSPNKDVC